MTPPRKMKFSVEITVVHVEGPLRDPEAVGYSIESHIDGETVQLTTDDASARSTYRVTEVEVLEELTS